MKNSDAKSRDAFFTKPHIAERFVAKVDEILDIKGFDNVIEPSAGAGDIYNLLPKHNRIGVDIFPMAEDIIKSDFFKYEIPDGSNIFVGNPPFGRNSDLAIRFFNKCATNASAIAFIIPRNWVNNRIHNHLNKDFGLYYSAILPKNSFTLDGSNYDVGCVAQIWLRTDLVDDLDIQPQFESWNDDVSQEQIDSLVNYQDKNNCYTPRDLWSSNKNLRMVTGRPKEHKDFKTCFFSPATPSNTPEFVLNQYNKSDWFMKYVGGRVVDDVPLDKGAHIGFFNCKKGVRKKMENIDWSFLGITKTMNPTIGMADIVYAYETQYK